MCRHVADCHTAGPGCAQTTRCPVSDVYYVGPLHGGFSFNQHAEHCNAMNEERYGNPGSDTWGERKRQININAQFSA